VFAESIAIDTLPPATFQALFRRNAAVAVLWRRFLLAQRLMKMFGVHARYVPEIPDASEHVLWQQFDYFVVRARAIE